MYLLERKAFRLGLKMVIRKVLLLLLAVHFTQAVILDPPFNVTVDSKTSRVVNISWVAGFDGSSPILNYTVKISEDNQNFSDTECQGSLSDNSCVLSNLSTSASLESLSPWTTYSIIVFARNVAGASNSSSVVNVTTDEEEPGATPVSVRGHNTSSTSILVTWDEVPADKQHGKIFHYTVIYKKKEGGTEKSKTVTTRTAELENLEKYTEYSIKVLAATIKGDGTPSDPIIVRTDQDKPSKAPVLTVVTVLNSTSIQLEWEPVPQAFTHGIITKYVIRYTDDVKETGEKDVPASPLKAVVNGLRQSATYLFQVLAATVKGNGPQSNTKSGATEDPPIPPTPSQGAIGKTEVFVPFTTKQALSNGKPVRYYQMIVIPLKEGQNPGKSSDKEYVTVTRVYDNQVEGEPYITAEFSNYKSRTTFPVGDGKYYSRAGVTDAKRKRRVTSDTKYLNGNLEEGARYAVFQRSFAEDGDYENLGFTTFATKKNTTIVILLTVAGIFLVLIVVGIIMWHRLRHNAETKSSVRNPQHRSTQEILELSSSVNLAASELAYGNPSYYNTNPTSNKPGTEGQVTYEEIGDMQPEQVAPYDDVYPTPESIYQEIGEGVHYQPLNINRQVTYEGYVKPASSRSVKSNF